MENLLAGNIGTNDGHGGRAAEHRAEMQEIARKVFESERAKLMDEITERMRAAQYQAYEQAFHIWQLLRLYQQRRRIPQKFFG